MVDWIDELITEIPINWHHVETTVAVDTEKELTQIKIKPMVLAESSSCYFDNMVLQVGVSKLDLLSEFVTQVAVPAISAETELLVFGTSGKAEIVDIFLMTEIAITGNSTDYIQLEIRNKNTAQLLTTKTFLTDINVTPYTVTPFGPIATEYKNLLAGQCLVLAAKKFGAGMALPPFYLIIVWKRGGV